MRQVKDLGTHDGNRHIVLVFGNMIFFKSIGKKKKNATGGAGKILLTRWGWMINFL